VELDTGIVDLVRARSWDWAVFTSSNAVECGLRQLPTPLAQRHAAIGRATARALERQGLAVAARPDQASSEGLLDLPEFADLAGRRMLLIKGRGGRELLRDSARARGAEVLELEVYRRSAARAEPPTVARLHSALSGNESIVIAATSVETLDSLLEQIPATDGPALRSRTLLVPGARVAAAAAGRGWTGAILEAGSAEDETMLAAVVRFAAGSSPAA
jgi:uroporphyrinogen-III synthase